MKSTGGLDLHRQRSQEELDEDPQVKQLGECAKLYTKLEECLADNDRDWKKCQPEVKALRDCHDRKAAGKGAQS